MAVKAKIFTYDEQWYWDNDLRTSEICDDPNPSEISDESSVAEEKRWKMISQLPKKYTHPEKHPEAYYTSRLLYFPELSGNIKCYSNYNGKISLFKYIALIKKKSYIII